MAAVKGHIVNTSATAHLLSQPIQFGERGCGVHASELFKALSWLFTIQVTS